MKKSLSLLLAIALVISMFATTAFAATSDLTPQQQFDVLKDDGIFTGYPDGTAGLAKQMTRAEFAKVLALLNGLPSDAASASVYTDIVAGHWAAGYIGAATKAGIVNGIAINKFQPNGKVTIEQLAKTLVLSVGLEESSDNVSGTISPWAKGYVAAAIKAGLLQPMASYKVNATRSQLVVAAYQVHQQLSVSVTGHKVIDANTVEVTFSDGGKETVKLTTALVAGVATTITATHNSVDYAVSVTLDKAAISASATGAKKITVTFNKAVDDTKATFVVKKGTLTLNVAGKTWAADKNSVVLDLSSKLSVGEYTVTVGGVEATDLTAKITATDEKVTKIEILSKTAPLTDVDLDGVKDDVSVSYKVTNQYGEDITKVTSLTPNIGTMDAANGLVNIVGNYALNNIIAVTLIHPATATSALATLTVSPEAKVAEITITGVYNKDNKVLSEDIALGTDAFYLVFDAKDQYGNPITKPSQLNLDIVAPVESNNTIVDANTTFENVDVNGTTKAALRLNAPASPGIKAGTTQITLISNTTGKNASYSVTVGSTTRADRINLQAPELVVQGEDAYIPVEVFDKDGNSITNLTALNEVTGTMKGIKITYDGNQVNNTFVMKDNMLQIKIPAGNVTATGLKSLVAMPATFTTTSNIANLTLDVKATAVATLIRGVDADFNKTNLASATGKTLSYTNMVIEDQYNRVMADDKVATWLSNNHARTIKVVEAGTPNNVVTFTDATIDFSGGAVFNSGSDNGSEKITLTLTGDTGADINTSSADVTLRVTNGTEYSSYTVDTIGTVYDEAVAGSSDNDLYDKEIKVYGVLGDGSKVQLSAAGGNPDYTVAALSNTKVNADVADNSTIDAVALTLPYDGTKTELVVPVTVTINKTGQQIVQDVTFSKVAPKVTSVKFVASNSVDADAITTKSVSGATFNLNTLLNGTNAWAVATDQYGVKVMVSANGEVTFPGVSALATVTYTVKPASGDITIANNGTVNATVSNVELGESFDVTVSFGNAAATVRVTRNA